MLRVPSLGRVASATVLSVVLLTAVSVSPVAAYKSTSADTGVIRVVDFANGDVWDSIGHFRVYWERTLNYSEMRYYWSFDYVYMVGAIEVYNQCPWHLCTDDASVFGVKFLDANGATVASYSNLAIGSCGRSSAWPLGWGGWSRCKANFSVPYAAKKIRFSWLITERPASGGVIAWSRTRTVAI